MKNSTINQMKVYLMMLSGRYGKGEYFIGADLSFKSGAKIFPAKVEVRDGRLTLTFGGSTKKFNWFDVAAIAADYDSMTMAYHERGTDALLTADERGGEAEIHRQRPGSPGRHRHRGRSGLPHSPAEGRGPVEGNRHYERRRQDKKRHGQKI